MDQAALIAAVVAGYLFGGVSTADWLAGRAGVDLRGGGSGNPGANNALRLGGRRLAIQVLTIEMIKGAVCVAVGAMAGGELGVVGAGVGAVAGNVLNPYRRLQGGQGLAIAAGVLITAVPVAALAGLVAIALAVRLVHRSAPAALIALAVVGVVSAWLPATPWGITHRAQATMLAAGIIAIVGAKQVTKLRSASRPPTPAAG